MTPQVRHPNNQGSFEGRGGSGATNSETSRAPLEALSGVGALCQGRGRKYRRANVVDGPA